MKNGLLLGVGGATKLKAALEPVKGLVEPVIAHRLPGLDAPGLSYVNRSWSLAPTTSRDELFPVGAVVLAPAAVPVAPVGSNARSREPLARIRVRVLEMGMNSMTRTSFYGATSKMQEAAVAKIEAEKSFLTCTLTCEKLLMNFSPYFASGKLC